MDFIVCKLFFSKADQKKKKKSSSTNCCDPGMLRHSSSLIILWISITAVLWQPLELDSSQSLAPSWQNISHAGEVIFQCLFGGFDILPDLKQATTTCKGILHSTDKELETDLLSSSLIQFNISIFSCYRTKHKAVGKLCKIKITNEVVSPDLKVADYFQDKSCHRDNLQIPITAITQALSLIELQQSTQEKTQQFLKQIFTRPPFFLLATLSK